MSRLITLECDANEVRLAVGSSGITGVSVERVMSAPIQIEEGTEPYGSPAAIAALRELLAQANIKSGQTIACVSRNDIELRAITLPLVDSNELPDMVRFAAPRYFANVNDNWPMDFITMPSHLEGSIDCIVGAINPALIQRIASTVEAVGLTLSHMVLRPMAAAAGALAKHPEWNNATILFIDLLNDEADVVIAEKGHAVFMRTFHALSDMSDPQSAKWLSGEVKRTIFSAISQRPGLRVDQIVVWTKESLAPFAHELSLAVELPVKMLDPFSMAEKANIAIAATTQTVGRFAPVLGALHFPQESRRLIDFANPRKKVEKKKPILQYAIAASTGVLALAGAWWWYSTSHANLDAEIATLNSLITSQTNAVKISTKNSADWKKLETFQKGDIRWLDELERLSLNAKNPDDAYFGVTTFSLEPKSNTATIAAKYYTKLQDFVPEIEAAYRDTNHTVRGTAVTKSPDKNYPQASDLTIVIAPPEVADPRNVKRRPIAPPPEPKADTSEVPEKEPTSAEPNVTAEGSEPSATETPPAETNSEPTATPPAASPSSPPATIPIETPGSGTTPVPVTPTTVPASPAPETPAPETPAAETPAPTTPAPEVAPSDPPGTPNSPPDATPPTPETTPPADAPIIGGAA
jgi:hypothetical protein